MKNIISFSSYKLNESANWKSVVDAAKNSTDGFHQEILNYSYANYNKISPSSFTFPGLVQWTIDNMGEEFGLLVFLGKYSQQVNNGGHMQYHDNGYDGSNNDRDEETPLHDEMEALFRQLGYDELPLGDKVLDIMSKYAPSSEADDCDSCGGTGYNEEDDDDEEDDDMYERFGGSLSCDYCGGSGESRDNYTMYIDETLDDKYYAIDDAWMVTLEHQSKLAVMREYIKLEDPSMSNDDIENVMHMYL